ARVHRHGRQRQTLSAGGTGSVQSEKRDLKFHNPVGSGDSLRQQIPREQIADLLFIHTGLLHGSARRQKLALALRFFPGILAESGIRFDHVEEMTQRSVSFLASHDGGRSYDPGRFSKTYAGSSFFLCHGLAPFRKLLSFYYIVFQERKKVCMYIN